MSNGPEELLHSLSELRPGDAKRRYRKSIFEDYLVRGPFGHCACAYCGKWSEKLTIDHIVPQSKGGVDFTKNVVCACHDCNQSKGHEHWKLWYVQQDFYTEDRFDKIVEWMKPDPPINLFAYRPRKNKVF